MCKCITKANLKPDDYQVYQDADFFKLTETADNF
jgi:hypothetical protein